jgi:hypothetical protein
VCRIWKRRRRQRTEKARERGKNEGIEKKRLLTGTCKRENRKKKNPREENE